MNFLAKLIERHRSDAASSLPMLEPRLPSRFEPVGNAAAPRLNEMDVEAETLRRPAEISNRVALREAPGQPSSAIQDQSPQRPDPRVSAVRSAIDATHATIQMTAPRITPAPSEGSLPTHEVPRLRRIRHSSPGVGESADAESPEHTPPWGRAPWLMPCVQTNARIVSPRSKTTDREAYDNMPDAMPTIHVTIGRVDVRAVVANAAPPARPMPRSDKNALEEYLRGRPRAHR